METKRGSQPAFATNDFVPQWMKKEDGKKGAGSKGFEHGAGVEHKARGKSDGQPPREPKPGSYQSHMQKQRSLDHNEGRRPPPVQKYRHYSGEDYYANGYGGYGGAFNNYENGGGVGGAMHPQYGSPPPAPLMRDPSYPFRMMNDGYNIYNGEPPYGYYGNGPVYGAPRGRGGRRGERHVGGRKDDLRQAPPAPVQEDFNTEFPSLNGEYNDGLRKGRANSTGAWDHRSGVHVLATKKDKSDGQKDRREELYKALIPAKVKIARRGQDNKLLLANTPVMNGGPTAPPPLPRDKKEVSVPIQILSSVKAAPKKLGNKTKFLRTLKEGENKASSAHDNGTAGKPDTVTSSKANGGGEGQENRQAHVLNGVRENGVGVPHAVNGLHDPEEFLSRSLEEEQRLLREMGWHESDTEEYEITEDEKREFFAKQQKQSPRQTNGHPAAAHLRSPPQQQPSGAAGSTCDTDDGSDDASSDSDLQAS